MAFSVCDTSIILAHFILKLEDGTIADSSRQRGNKPALFRLADDSLSAELRQQLIGMKTGEVKTFSLSPQAAFGEHNPDLVQYFSCGEFLASGVPKPGTVMLFTAINGSEMPGLVTEVSGDSVTVDFNHPLAGHTVQFAIEIVQIDPQEQTANADITG